MNDELRDDFEPPEWDVPGWNWEPSDYTWLSSHSGIYKDGTSIFFIHGGRIRHQAHIPHGRYDVEEFCQLLRDRAADLDESYVVWSGDTGDESADFWIEGTRAPNTEDFLRLQSARDRQKRDDEIAAAGLRQRRPDLFDDSKRKES